jgi:hypothetical protein
MYKVEDVKPLPEYRLRMRYSDGIEGVVDLSHLAGKGVFVVCQRIAMVFISERAVEEPNAVRQCGLFPRTSRPKPSSQAPISVRVTPQRTLLSRSERRLFLVVHGCTGALFLSP